MKNWTAWRKSFIVYGKLPGKWMSEVSGSDHLIVL
jgi:hypothetical protein